MASASSEAIECSSPQPVESSASQADVSMPVQASQDRRRRKQLHLLQRSLSPTEFKFPHSVLREYIRRRSPMRETARVQATSTKRAFGRATAMESSPLTNELVKKGRKHHRAYSSFEFPAIDQRPAFVTHLRQPKAPAFAELKQRFTHFHRPHLRHTAAQKPAIQLLPLKEVSGALSFRLPAIREG